MNKVSQIWPDGTQTLGRGLTLMVAVSAGHTTIPALMAHLTLSRSTTQRLASALVQTGWLVQNSDHTYALGPCLLELASGQEENPLRDLAKPLLRNLGDRTRDTVHLGIRSGDDVLYLDKVYGQRGLEMRSRTGLRLPLALTGIGRALILDDTPMEWERLYHLAGGQPEKFASWLTRMRGYQKSRHVFDLEDNEPGIHCVAAPVCDSNGQITAALSVASASPYLPRRRMEELAPMVRHTAEALSRQLGWKGERSDAA
ncbi:IclR family transcriptional regulator [Acetobacter oeni]|uniref:IclR family transcriptional regulator n=1 Tax=Acetobacter oeni TaxID=304077 RepID=A0A511XHL1_9PROT|nr:IclR family transcriptional regulator [Acetobacter oeni]MBB3881281.1 DNA-binding IclR family transcriptional regulator [Acetobacter oeni]NHO18156.1 helix-turn-helix domain-containing protein [Acetobacter oeni]GBR08106.1 IclR family transcriptional regulator [Acetobacter oeni LMG 21952]GEN62436.1 IclR family transcriptional regulator [Acetobacter oeni]